MSSEESFHELAGSAQEAIQSAVWYEVKLTCKPGAFYRLLLESEQYPVLMFHHFYEPWWREGAVARIALPGEFHVEIARALREEEGVAGAEPWKREEDDRELFGEFFDYGMMFFFGSSMLAAQKMSKEEYQWMTGKLVHCVLNARGLNVKDEIRWGLGFVWKRITLKPRLWWLELKTGRKWWENA